ncbi:cytidine deaminase-like protein [Xylogone sp. PMI_703]|nr:cytidine deaminase-like protein [Xylogone sp. PMI_703]
MTQAHGEGQQCLPEKILSIGNGTAPSGQLIPLKTMLETTARDRLLDVYITSVPPKKASGILGCIRQIVPNDGGLDLQHLRRFAKPKDLPLKVKNVLFNARGTMGQASENEPIEELFVIIGSVNSISIEILLDTLSSLIESPWAFPIQVPLLAPTSQEQASKWSSLYWPTIYKKSNPFGPHPSIVARAADEISADTGKWMQMATMAAQQSKQLGIGDDVGVVIVERINGAARPLAVTGDARWMEWPCGGSGNVTAHAVLRAIAMIAEGLRIKDSEQGLDVTFDQGNTIFRESSIGLMEGSQAQAVRDGYLCHELEIYCTHEPCVMCSMAIVHSRFGRVIFERRMPNTGGLSADNKLGHGLFWRKELNWTLLAWQWVPASGSFQTNTIDPSFHA